MIALSEKLIVDCSKGIIKVAKFLKGGFGAPKLQAVFQNAKQAKILLAGITCSARFCCLFILAGSILQSFTRASFILEETAEGHKEIAKSRVCVTNQFRLPLPALRTYYSCGGLLYF